MPKFRRIVGDDVEAVQYVAGALPPAGVTPPDYSTDPPRPAYLTTPAGVCWPLDDGDWILTHPSGRGYWCVERDEFPKLCRPADGSSPVGCSPVVDAMTVDDFGDRFYPRHPTPEGALMPPGYRVHHEMPRPLTPPERAIDTFWVCVVFLNDVPVPADSIDTLFGSFVCGRGYFAGEAHANAVAAAWKHYRKTHGPQPGLPVSNI